MVWTVGVDVGGTFTDFFAVDELNGSGHGGKFPAPTGNPAESVRNGCGTVTYKQLKLLR